MGLSGFLKVLGIPQGGQVTAEQAQQVPPERFSRWRNTPSVKTRPSSIRQASSIPSTRNWYNHSGQHLWP